MTNISIIGGDLRIVQLAEMMSQDGFNVFTYGLERANKINENEKIRKCGSLKELISSADIIVSSIPFTKDGININMPFSDTKVEIKELGEYLKNKTLIAGRIDKSLYEETPEAKVIDLLEREDLTVLNAIASAEGTIQVAMEETEKTLNGSNILIIGFGRITKVLFNMLKGFGANIYCETTKKENVSWIKAYGYTPIIWKDLEENLGKFDLIINTAPHIILDDAKLSFLKKDCVIVDVASDPGGVDRESAKKRNIKLIWALALPGKVAPITSAEYIKETLYNIFKEL